MVSARVWIVGVLALGGLIGLVTHFSWGFLGLEVVLVMIVLAAIATSRIDEDPDELLPRVSRWAATKRRTIARAPETRDETPRQD